MAYIRFAGRSGSFSSCFSCGTAAGKSLPRTRRTSPTLIALIRKNLGISEEEAYRFHLEMWVYVHGIATMIATGYLNWDEDFVSKVLSDAYQGLMAHYRKKKGGREMNNIIEIGHLCKSFGTCRPSGTCPSG